MTAVEESTEVSASEFRQAMGHFATGVTVVTSIADDGEPVGTTASAVTSLSLDPPLVLVCFDRASLTLHAIRSHGAFVINVLAAPSSASRPTSPAAAWQPPGRTSGTGRAPPAARGWRVSWPCWSARSKTGSRAATTRS